MIRLKSIETRNQRPDYVTGFSIGARVRFDERVATLTIELEGTEAEVAAFVNRLRGQVEDARPGAYRDPEAERYMREAPGSQVRGQLAPPALPFVFDVTELPALPGAHDPATCEGCAVCDGPCPGCGAPGDAPHEPGCSEA